MAPQNGFKPLDRVTKYKTEVIVAPLKNFKPMCRAILSPKYRYQWLHKMGLNQWAVSSEVQNISHHLLQNMKTSYKKKTSENLITFYSVFQAFKFKHLNMYLKSPSPT